MLKLPRLLESDPRLHSIRSQLSSLSEPPWSSCGGMALELKTVSSQLKQSLFFARRCGGLQIGVMSIKALLEMEHKGLLAANGPGFFQTPPRVCRLLLVANDGSPRFYHQCNSVVKAAKGRVLAFQLPIGSGELSQLLSSKKEGVVRAVLVSQRDPVSKTLTALLGLEEASQKASDSSQRVQLVTKGLSFSADALGQ